MGVPKIYIFMDVPKIQVGIAGGKKHQVIEICTVQAEGVSLPVQCYPGFAPELLLAFSASRVSSRNKNDNIIAF
jgi:hypothetical protein